MAAIELLKEFGFRLGEPHSKTLAGTDGLKELRIKVGSDICRIFYFHHKNTLYVATSGYIKKEMKTDHGEIERAQKLREIFEKEMLQ
ncbi:type II toxin-antitoxin system RelE/ParE family toxin [Chlorobium sp. KB01]|uniref:type II toxin-antitoxin system RelE/ParE family toxin n=1 Tax=Chlorobium sp. KB01 TaxID=1917528 RepID=UPI0018EA1FEC